MEADTEGECDLKRMLSTIGLQIASFVVEVLQTGLQIDTKIRREIVLKAQT